MRAKSNAVKHAAFGLAIALATSLSCFDHPDDKVAQMTCKTNDNCPIGYICKLPGVVGGCRKPGDTSDLDSGQPGDALSAPDGSKLATTEAGQAQIDSSADSASGEAESRSGGYDQGTGGAGGEIDAQADAPGVLGAIDGGDVRVVGSGGFGGGVGSGGVSGTDSPLSTGGVADSGRDVATGCTVDSGRDIAAGGVVASGGSFSTGGVVGSGGTVSTGGVVASGGTIATGGVVASGGTIATGGTSGSGGSTGLPVCVFDTSKFDNCVFGP